ncbi:MAG TPA: UvrD-helicase domain-containing protein [Pseudobdellovibrionaceae bacterium]|nr:UvrD-helicase domain-containing protein [Pseudobdellovibrionaceae bacterium]
MSSPSLELEFKTKIIKAGAGAGKTTTLVQEFVDFVLNFEKTHDKFPRIVVTTFTRKATQELKERLMARAFDLNRPDLLDYISNKSMVHISTIHGILFSFLSKYGYMISLAGDLSIKSDQELRYEKQIILKKIIKQNEHLFPLLEEYEWSQILNMVTLYFRSWMQNPDMKRISPEELNLMTLKKWKELFQQQKEICEFILQNCKNSKWNEYISIWLNLMNPNEDNLEQLSKQFGDFLSNVKKPSFLKANPPFEQELHEQFEINRAEIKSLTEEATYQPSSWRQHEEFSSLFEELGDLYVSTYFDQKVENLQLSMDDLEILSLHLSNKAPESTVAFSEEWDFWMIDEYQDTSPLQEKLLKSFIQQKPAFYVGDPQQSIYLFRGARSELFQEKFQQLEATGGECLSKMINYRSTSCVLTFFNHYFTRLNAQFSAMEPHAQDDPIEYKNNHELPIQVLISDTSEKETDAEVDTVIFRIQELLSQGIKPEQICVLSRTHKMLSLIMEKALKYKIETQVHGHQNYNQQREVLDLIFMNKFILNPHDNLNFISLLRSPWFYVSDQGISKICAKSHLVEKSLFKSFWRNYLQRKTDLLLSSEDLQVLKQLELFVENIKTQPLHCILMDMLKTSGMLDYCHYLDPSGKREANLWKYITLLSSQMRRPGFQALKFIESFELDPTENGNSMMSEAVPVIEPQKVNLMTIHASKGLQFEHVIIPGMGKAAQKSKSDYFMMDQQLSRWTLLVRDPDSQENIKSPLAAQILNAFKFKEDQEVQRVLYVAMTRAKKGISLIWSSDFSKNSWAAEFPLNIDVGVHELEDTKYFVRQENFIPKNILVEINLKKDLTPRLKMYPAEFEPSGNEKISKKISVTQHLQKTLPEFQKSNIKNEKSDWVKVFTKVEYGINLHKKLEKLKYISESSLVKKIKDPSLEPGIRYVLSLQDPPLLKIIQSGEVEWGFSFQEDKISIEGQVDLWSLVDDVLYVVDYKTGRTDFLEKAYAQLEIYQKAICLIRRLKPKTIKLCVLFTEHEQVFIREANFYAEKPN